MERVLRQERRLVARWERVDWASLECGRQIEELKMVPAESEVGEDIVCVCVCERREGEREREGEYIHMYINVLVSHAHTSTVVW